MLGEKLTRISLLDSTEVNPKQDSSDALGTAFPLMLNQILRNVYANAYKVKRKKERIFFKWKRLSKIKEEIKFPSSHLSKASD